MKLLEAVVIALKSLYANKLRSSLTMLGVIIGVGAVITLMSVGQGVQANMTSTFESMGSNLVYVMPKTPGATGLASMMTAVPNLTLDDAEAIADPRNIRGVVGVAPTNENYSQASFGGESTFVAIEGVTQDWDWIVNYPVASGQFLGERHVATKAMVAVLGSKAAENLFEDEDPVGKKVKILKKEFTVIGVFEEKGGSVMGVSMDDIVAVPITTFQTKLFPLRTPSGEYAVQTIGVKVESADLIPEVSDQIETLLRKRHRLAADDENDFAVVTMEQMLSTFGEITAIFTLFLGAIAGISLLVGGIGIMNIMLVSVTERTREIGVRKAVGAKRRDILLQFLFEAATLSVVGGAIGIVGGWFLSTMISTVSASAGMQIHTSVSVDIVVLAASVSVFIGLVSGVYPAMRAARLHPIDALHYQ